MEKGSSPLANTCSFIGIKPFMTDLPYPPIQVGGKNEAYANLLSIDYCGSVSELSAITQYINNENRISCENCSLAKTFLGIAVAEMMHLQKLGEMIVLLGGNVGFTAKYRNAMHIKMIRDEDVDAVLERIIQDEEYHIMLLKALL